MLIIIAGDGNTGSHLAKILSGENQDIVLMGLDRRRLADLESEYNFITYAGNPTYADDLLQCGVNRADLFVAVTPDENMNIVGCSIAKRLGAALCAGRIDSPQLATPESIKLLRNMGVDMAFIPEKSAAVDLDRYLVHNWFPEYMRINRGQVLIVGVRVAPGAPLCGKALSETAIQGPRTFHVIAIRRHDSLIIPRGDDVVEPDDMLYVSTLSKDLDKIREACGIRPVATHNVFIAGGGRITEHLLEMAHGRYRITVFDPDRERCRVLAAKFPDVVVVGVSCDDVATLKDEGIEHCDMFLALTGNSEANMVSCMVARSHGVDHTVARIEELQYIPEAESLNINKIINKKRLNAAQVLDTLLATGAGNGQCLSIDGAEIASVVVGDHPKGVGKPVSQLSLPRGITLAAVIRNGEGHLVEGSTVILPGDVVVVLFLSGMMQKVQNLFK